MSRVVFSSIIKFGGNNATIMLSKILKLKRLSQVSYSNNNNEDIFLPFFTETCSWERPVATLFTTNHPLTMAFHSFDKQLIIANETDMIRYVIFLKLVCLF